MATKLINNKKFTFALMGTAILLMLYLAVSAIYFKVDKVNIVTESAINVKDESELVGFSDNVFVGKVVGKESEVKLDETPETQYKVEVLSNIKGNLKGKVIVNCLGGIENDVTYTVDNNKQLKAGNTYVFSTRYNQKMNWYTSIPVYGEVLVTDDLQKGKVIRKMENGFKNQKVKFKDNRNKK